MARLLHRAALIACAAILLALGAASTAFALDAFWQGRRDAFWEHGNNGLGVSNWYSKPPLRGQPLEVPNRAAIFAQGALEYDIVIREPESISLMVFRKNPERYTFAVRWSLTIRNGGIRNYDPSPPLFTIFKNSAMLFRDNAELVADGDWKSALIKIRRGGQLWFQEHSRGGNAAVENYGGDIFFLAMASAGRMTINNNPQPDGGKPSITDFGGRSTGGNAHFSNGRNGILSFADTRGPVGEGVSAGRIDNDGRLQVGNTALNVRDSFTQGSRGTLWITHGETRHGSIHVKNDMRLGGTLLTTGFFMPDLVGRHTILRAEGRRIGKFDNETLNGGRLEYGPKTVVLVIGD